MGILTSEHDVTAHMPIFEQVIVPSLVAVFDDVTINTHGSVLGRDRVDRVVTLVTVVLDDVAVEARRGVLGGNGVQVLGITLVMILCDVPVDTHGCILSRNVVDLARVHTLDVSWDDV